MRGRSLISAPFFAEARRLSSDGHRSEDRLNNSRGVIVEPFECRLVGNRAPHLVATSSQQPGSARREAGPEQAGIGEPPPSFDARRSFFRLLAFNLHTLYAFHAIT
jgi:hypothetical protein